MDESISERREEREAALLAEVGRGLGEHGVRTLLIRRVGLTLYGTAPDDGLPASGGGRPASCYGSGSGPGRGDDDMPIVGLNGGTGRPRIRS